MEGAGGAGPCQCLSDLFSNGSPQKGSRRVATRRHSSLCHFRKPNP